ncbi:hypothetical protein PSTT_12617 [Puccinia striiformis]|uniref:CID domain-containing protein n=1 Tax=Puccinia striiformis TaxID=27350 RepID=A0A2S4UVB3_9BASI|nr:hypothetical protein PSTT_12617 [Puccinia striiformis]
MESSKLVWCKNAILMLSPQQHPSSSPRRPLSTANDHLLKQHPISYSSIHSYHQFGWTITHCSYSQEALNAFVSGPIKKSKFVKEKEAAEAKKREEDELASKAYEDFVAAFDGNDRGSERGRGVGSSSSHGRSTQGPAFVKPGGAPRTVVKLDSPGEESPPPHNRASLASHASASASVPTPATHFSLPPNPTIPTTSKKIESRKDAEREGRLAAKASKDPRGMSITALAALETAPHLSGGSRDTGDPLTTNVHVGNLPGTICEQSLGTFCVKWGPIASIKIMWPRSGSDNIGGAGYGMVAMRQSKSGGLNGFVSYMRRSDAERACRELDGFDWGGNILRTGWGKAMPMPPGHKPQFGMKNMSFLNYLEKLDRLHAHLHLEDVDMDVPPVIEKEGPAVCLAIRATTVAPAPVLDPALGLAQDTMMIVVVPPNGEDYSRSRSPSGDRRNWPKIQEDEEKFIRTVAKKVLEHGERFERTLRERERTNPKFKFLIETDTAAYHFFRMLVDRHYRPPSPPPPPFADDGYASIYSTDSAEESENERLAKGKLGKYSRRRFQAMLRSLTPQREKIARCMAFALHHADAADEIAEILVQSLTIDMTPVPRKLARLYVISDILHNSSNSLPNAWKYRQILEKLLPDVFDHLNLIYRSFPGRIKAENFKKQICLIVNVWNSFMVFGQNSIDDFNERLVKVDVDDEEVQQAIDGEDVRIPLDDGEDVDGVAADESLLWAGEEPEVHDGLPASAELDNSKPARASGFAKAFKPAVMEPSKPANDQSSKPGVKLAGAIKLA